MFLGEGLAKHTRHSNSRVIENPNIVLMCAIGIRGSRGGKVYGGVGSKGEFLSAIQ